MSQDHNEAVALSNATWISLIAMIVTAVAANLATIYGMSINIQNRMDRLDERWQERTAGMASEVRADIERIEQKIPPDWFRSMVERNSADIRELRDKVFNDLPPEPK